MSPDPRTPLQRAVAIVLIDGLADVIDDLEIDRIAVESSSGNIIIELTRGERFCVTVIQGN